MIQTKLKQCAGCSNVGIMYKCIGRARYCRTCAFKMNPPKRIAFRSAKRIAKDVLYKPLAVQFKIDNPVCQVNLPGCQVQTTDVHHLYSGIDRDKYLLDVSTWKSACRHCHTILHDDYSSVELVEMHLKLIDTNN